MNRHVNVSWMAALVALALLAGCGGKEPQPQPNQVVQVKLTGHQIEMPGAVAPGRTTFKLTNTDTKPHSFAIDGPAGESGLKDALQPGQSTTLEVDLWPGTYRVHCPQDEGLMLALQVSETAHS